MSFGVSGIYLSFLLVTAGSLVARLRGWKPQGSFTLGRWGLPVTVLAVLYGFLMLLNVVVPTGLTSPKAVLFNYDWITLTVMLLIVVLGAIYYLVSRPDRRVERKMARAADQAPAAAVGA